MNIKRGKKNYDYTADVFVYYNPENKWIYMRLNLCIEKDVRCNSEFLQWYFKTAPSCGWHQ